MEVDNNIPECQTVKLIAEMTTTCVISQVFYGIRVKIVVFKNRKGSKVWGQKAGPFNEMILPQERGKKGKTKKRKNQETAIPEKPNYSDHITPVTPSILD